MKPLFRKVNTTAHFVPHREGGDYADSRNSKRRSDLELKRESMGARVRRGLDYTPLFRFLLSKIGEDWDKVHSDAVARLDRAEPIFWMVALSDAERRDYFVAGESAYFSGLFVDDDNRVQKVAPETDETTLTPLCKCCTHTFNGVLFSRKFCF